MISNPLKVCVLLLIPQCHGFLLDLIGLGGSTRGPLPEKGECAHWGSVNPYASPFTTETGEMFNSNDLIAAHRTLPINSYATVTNELDGRSVVVRITGRGPFSAGRLMELSPAAFNQIADLSEAVIPCSVSVKRNAGVNPNNSGIFPPSNIPNQPGYPQSGHPRPGVPSQSGTGYRDQHGYPQTRYPSEGY